MRMHVPMRTHIEDAYKGYTLRKYIKEAHIEDALLRTHRRVREKV